MSSNSTAVRVRSSLLAGCAAVILALCAVVAAPQSAHAQDTSYLVMYPGKQSTIKSSYAGLKWCSSNKAIATVTKAGKVTAKRPGSCLMRTTVNGYPLSVSVEVATKTAYKAVKNAKADSKLHLRYSQPKRMKAKYRDCSSYVGRCYWDLSMGRHLVDIGGVNWPLDAAGQAKWLNKQKLCVAKKAVSVKYLLPGDTIYYETGYAGKNKGYRHIDHAAIYLGGGLIADTCGPKKDTIGIRWYWEGDRTVRFIGRPSATLTMNKTECALKKGRTTTLAPKFAQNKSVKWSTSNAKVAKVSKSGVVTAKGAGACRIYAKVDGKKISCRVTVA